MEVTMTPTLMRMLGFRENDKLTRDIVARNAPNLHFTLPTLWIYSNIIEQSLLGDATGNLLGILNTEIDDKKNAQSPKFTRGHTI